MGRKLLFNCLLLLRTVLCSKDFAGKQFPATFLTAEVLPEGGGRGL